jgi:hypothetical protein
MQYKRLCLSSYDLFRRRGGVPRRKHTTACDTPDTGSNLERIYVVCLKFRLIVPEN